MESHTRDIACMAFESEERARVGRTDVVELYIVGSGGGEKTLVRGYAEPIDL